jgi:hypothetical protein
MGIEMKARITIEYELPWPEGLTQAELREREEEARAARHCLKSKKRPPDLGSLLVTK